MKCFVHIGTEKTGTSSIQRLFATNREVLASHGFYYPVAPGDQNHRRLPVLAYDSYRRDDYTSLHELFTDDAVVAHQAEIFAAISQELNEAALVNPDFVYIFSSEHIHSRVAKPRELRRFKAVLERLGFSDISIVVYLREPADLAASLFSTAVKSGSSADAPPGPEDAYFGRVCDHRRTLQLYEDVFGRERLVVKLYERSSWVQESLLLDLCLELGMNFFEQLKKPARVNESLSTIGVELLLRVNKEIPKYIDGKFNKQRGNIAAHFEHRFGGGKYELPEDLRIAYEDHFRDSNDWVLANYFPGRSALFAAHAAVSSRPFSKDELLDCIAGLVVDLWTNPSVMGRVHK